MPTVARVGSYRFFFFSNEGTEPPHIHVQRERCLSTLALDAAARARHVRVTRDELIVDLQDGRTVSVPLAWFPRLLHATARQRRRWELLGDGEGVRWPEVDEDLSVAGLLRGTPASQVESANERPAAYRVKQPSSRRQRTRSSRRLPARRG